MAKHIPLEDPMRSVFLLTLSWLGAAQATSPGTSDPLTELSACSPSDDGEDIELTVDPDTLAGSDWSPLRTIGCGKTATIMVRSDTARSLSVGLTDDCAGTDSIGGIWDGSSPPTDLTQTQTFPDATSTTRSFRVENGTFVKVRCLGGGSGCALRVRFD
jgi:hypothetical protein